MEMQTSVISRAPAIRLAVDSFLLYKLLLGLNWGINKRSEFGLRTGTEVFKTGFYEGIFRAQTGTIVHSRNFLVLFRP